MKTQENVQKSCKNVLPEGERGKELKLFQMQEGRRSGSASTQAYNNDRDHHLDLRAGGGRSKWAGSAASRSKCADCRPRIGKCRSQKKGARRRAQHEGCNDNGVWSSEAQEAAIPLSSWQRPPNVAVLQGHDPWPSQHWEDVFDLLSPAPTSPGLQATFHWNGRASAF